MITVDGEALVSLIMSGNSRVKQKAKGVAKTSIHYSLVMARKIATKNPKLKETIKRSIVGHLVSTTFKPDDYTRWVWDNLFDFRKIPYARAESNKLAYKPLISILLPTYNTDPRFLRDCLDSVVGQVYENWELCIVDDCSSDERVRSIIEEYAKNDPRISCRFLATNKHIAGATNEAAKLASGEFLALFDHDDLLWPTALLEVAKALNIDKNLDFIYTDEDKITEDTNHHLGPFFKPDVNRELLRSVNYVTHFSVVRESLFKRIGGLRSEYNGAQDWDLFLRIFRTTDKIHHISKVLYSWRIHDLSTAKNTDTKPYVVEAQKRAIEDDLKQRGVDGAVVSRDAKHKGYWKVAYPLKDEPLVSIIIPSKNQLKIVKRCVDSIFRKTTYKNFEVILVDTGSDDPSVWRWYEKISKHNDNFRVIKWHENRFSYAKSCNVGAREAKGELLVMLNNDTEVVTNNWLELMASDAIRPRIGAVGVLLFFPDGYHIQHAGVGVGLGGVAANSFSMMTLTQPLSQTQHIYLNTRHEMTAVTAACLMIRKEVYDEIGGFDESYRVTYNDVDLCLRLYERGYRNLYTPYVRLLHHESISVGLPEEIEKRDTKEMRTATEQFVKQWKSYIEHDPNINQQLSKHDAFYNIPPQYDPAKKQEIKSNR